MAIPKAGRSSRPPDQTHRKYIREAFTQILAEKSFKSITVKEITDRARGEPCDVLRPL